MRFKDLRVLEMSSLPIPTFPSEIVQLVGLRYIALVAEEGCIPASISDLQYLETLIVWIIYPTYIVPGNILKMVSLRHLTLSGKYHFEEAESGYVLENLRSLFYLDPFSKSTEEILKRTPNLRKLQIRAVQFASTQITRIHNLDQLNYLDKLNLRSSSSRFPKSTDEMLKRTPNLRKLQISAFQYDSTQIMRIHNLDKLNYLKNSTQIMRNHNLDELNYLEKLQLHSFRISPYMLPESLKKLTLIRTQLAWNVIQIIGMLPNLEVLKLRKDSCSGGRWETSDGGFCRLKYLELGFLDHWHTHSEHFPNLVHLKVRGCDRLEEIPLGLGDIYTLEIIEVCFSWRNIYQSAFDIKEDQEAKGNDLLKILARGAKYIGF